jgi:DNA-3-methyladenine glycosylase II
MIPAAIAHLSKADKKLARVIRKIGLLEFKPAKKRSPFAALTKAVIGQQLNGAAATTIFKRLAGLLPSGALLEHEEILTLSDDALRSAGLSWAKTATVKELSKRAAEGVLPSKSKILKMDDEEVIEALTEIKGIGRWTVEMFLIFTLGRPDVLPVHDFSVRKGFGMLHGMKDLPNPKEMIQHAEAWRPHRTTAALYLYRLVDSP